MHEFDERGRLRLGKVVNGFLLEDEKTVLFLDDHFTIFNKSDYESQLKKLSKSMDLDLYSLTIFSSGESKEYKTDPQGRFLVPQEIRKKAFNEKEVYIIPVEFDGLRSVEVYSKKTYQNLVDKISHQKEMIKGKENEEGRRKD